MIITAHAGSDGTKNNSLESIAYCIALSVDAFEVDVRKYKGELVLSHNKVRKGEQPTALWQVFALMRPHSSIRVNCDLKERGLQLPVYSMADIYGLTDRLIFTGAVSLDEIKKEPRLNSIATSYINLEGMSEKFYERLSYLWNEKDLTGVLGILESIDYTSLKEAGINVINVAYQVCLDPFMELMEKNGLRISAWTVDDMDEIKRLSQFSIVENITTNLAKEADIYKKNLKF